MLQSLGFDYSLGCDDDFPKAIEGKHSVFEGETESGLQYETTKAHQQWKAHPHSNAVPKNTIAPEGMVNEINKMLRRKPTFDIEARLERLRSKLLEMQKELEDGNTEP